MGKKVLSKYKCEVCDKDYYDNEDNDACHECRKVEEEAETS